MEALFEGLPDSPFFVKDVNLRYVAANSAMAELCGARRASDLYGKRAGDFFAAKMARHYEAMDQLVLAGGRPVSNKLDLANSRAAGPAWLLFSRLPVTAADATIVGVVANSRRLRPMGPSDAKYDRLSRVLDRIETDYSQPLRLAELSVIAGTSKSQLQRDFKLLFRISIREFIQRTRIERALELLGTDLEIAFIACDCGYTDQSAFSRSFKSVTGVSPQDYKRRILV
jgi:AraC-like DNA-binding protein